MTVGRAVYRTRQFAQYALGGAAPVDDGAVRAVLPAALATIFLGMDPASQRHHLAVFRRVVAAGCDDPDVVAAALLHDLGKGRVSPLDRTAWVLLERTPWLASRLAGDGRRGWTALYRLAHHPAIGAAQVGAAGGSDRLVWLIANHQRNDLDDPGLRILRAADDES
ncbi:MAG: HD domain-containing protein [Dehalococcoidia bacterium]